MLILIGGAAIFASSIGDDDDGGGGDNGPGNGSQDDGDGSGGGLAVGNNCEANLPPELSLVECGYSIFTRGEGMTVSEANVGLVVENVSGETLSGVHIELEGFDAEGNEVMLSGLGSLGLLRPGERAAFGGSSSAAGEENPLDRVVVTGDPSALSEPFPDMIPSGTLSVSNIEIEPGVEVQLGVEGTKVHYTVESQMDRQVQVTAHVLFRNEQGAIIGYAGDPYSLQPGQTDDRDIETTVPGIADAEIYVTSPPALS